MWIIFQLKLCTKCFVVSYCQFHIVGYKIVMLMLCTVVPAITCMFTVLSIKETNEMCCVQQAGNADINKHQFQLLVTPYWMTNRFCPITNICFFELTSFRYQYDLPALFYYILLAVSIQNSLYMSSTTQHIDTETRGKRVAG